MKNWYDGEIEMCIGSVMLRIVSLSRLENASSRVATAFNSSASASDSSAIADGEKKLQLSIATRRYRRGI